MFAKILAISALVAVTQAGLSDYASNSISYSSAHIAAPIASHGYAAPAITHSYAAPAPVISHGYAAPAIIKSVQHEEDYYHEERDGDVVKGYYTVAEPDGTLRTVHYTADDHNGFNAVVEKSGHPVHPAPAPVYGKAIVAAAPVHYHH
ncbi:hypothetical protein NQ314_003220 [Rhamnusium bicolor]|uniref:Uncharacterized protein n=1 Tax=Rhamnusium bicolor TaxID=1586634 RepID=A0AAV8ZP75_9CUCU|nr:hypothetical protein NQ314_003220 [Rhamnusium bicolor]